MNQVPATATQRRIAAGKKHRTKADRQAEMRAKLEAKNIPSAEGLAERMTASLAAKAVPPPPKPSVGQVWRTPNDKVPRYVAVVAVEKDSADVVEITREGARVETGISRGRPFRTSLIKGDMNPSGYLYEPGIAVDIESLLQREKENEVSTNHAESVPGIPSPKKAKSEAKKAKAAERAAAREAAKKKKAEAKAKRAEERKAKAAARAEKKAARASSDGLAKKVEKLATKLKRVEGQAERAVERIKAAQARVKRVEDRAEKAKAHVKRCAARLAEAQKALKAEAKA